jgi:hypothetical protein
MTAAECYRCRLFSSVMKDVSSKESHFNVKPGWNAFLSIPVRSGGLMLSVICIVLLLLLLLLLYLCLLFLHGISENNVKTDDESLKIARIARAIYREHSILSPRRNLWAFYLLGNCFYCMIEKNLINFFFQQASVTILSGRMQCGVTDL